jgi:hypothetical protein
MDTLAVTDGRQRDDNPDLLKILLEPFASSREHVGGAPWHSCGGIGCNDEQWPLSICHTRNCHCHF